MNLVKRADCHGDTDANSEQDQDIGEYQQKIESEGNQSLSQTRKTGRYQCSIPVLDARITFVDRPLSLLAVRRLRA